jgi:hypothetical protein
VKNTKHVFHNPAREHCEKNRRGSNPGNISVDHCEKKRTWFSQWSVVIKSKMPNCCGTRTDHCEKNGRDTPAISSCPACHPNQPFVEPCQKKLQHPDSEILICQAVPINRARHSRDARDGRLGRRWHAMWLVHPSRSQRAFMKNSSNTRLSESQSRIEKARHVRLMMAAQAPRAHTGVSFRDGIHDIPLSRPAKRRTRNGNICGGPEV